MSSLDIFIFNEIQYGLGLNTFCCQNGVSCSVKKVNSFLQTKHFSYIMWFMIAISKNDLRILCPKHNENYLFPHIYLIYDINWKHVVDMPTQTWTLNTKPVLIITFLDLFVNNKKIFLLQIFEILLIIPEVVRTCDLCLFIEYYYSFSI